MLDFDAGVTIASRSGVSCTNSVVTTGDRCERGDESMRPGGCVIESELGTLDADLETQLRMLENALGGAK